MASREQGFDYLMLRGLPAVSIACDNFTRSHVNDHDATPNHGPIESQADLEQGFVGPWLEGGVVWSLTLTLAVASPSCITKQAIASGTLKIDAHMLHDQRLQG
ncbi:hypothetical protein BDZ89DRAFT_1152491 [Hymenopellis radicata]|nr:hypothetical protein BDZ89DRAFT_1152491 [Hymenopellis radicata]